MLNYRKKDNPENFNSNFVIPTQDNRSHTYSFVIKRIADILFSIILLLILAIPITIVIILIKLDSPGSVFFTQNRIGLEQKSFKLFKFRTMVENASSMQSNLEDKNEIEGAVLFKIKEDPRITSVGKILRRYSIDEIPQLINVIKGDMSLVGPRPLTPRDSSKLSSNQQHYRNDILPGITGLWQVNGRSETNSKQLHIYDYIYVTKWSLGLDLLILLKTIFVVVSAKGAY